MEARPRTRTVLALATTAVWILLAGTELYTQTMGFVCLNCSDPPTYPGTLVP